MMCVDFGERVIIVTNRTVLEEMKLLKKELKDYSGLDTLQWLLQCKWFWKYGFKNIIVDEKGLTILNKTYSFNTSIQDLSKNLRYQICIYKKQVKWDNKLC